jgi:hypothetical protein
LATSCARSKVWTRSKAAAAERRARLSSTLMRTAEVLDSSAGLAEAHAERHEQAGRSDDAAEERRAAARAREAAQRARSQAEHWLEIIADQQQSRRPPGPRLRHFTPLRSAMALAFAHGHFPGRSSGRSR